MTDLTRTGLPRAEAQAAARTVLPHIPDPDDRADVLTALGLDGDLVPLRLVPVEVFGASCTTHCPDGECESAFGLCDAVEAWSDYNRAYGHLYRKDDTDPKYREPGDTVEVFARRADLPWFERRFGEPGGEPDGTAPLVEVTGEDLHECTKAFLMVYLGHVPADMQADENGHLSHPSVRAALETFAARLSARNVRKDRS